MASETLPQLDGTTLYRVLFAQHPQPMWVYDTVTLSFLDVNAAAVARYGYTRDEFLALTILDIRPAPEAARLQQTLTTRGSGRRHSGPWIHTTKSGETVVVEVDSQDIDLAGRAAVLVTVRDITSREGALSTLRESEERFRLLAKATNDAIWDWDLVANTFWWNEGFEALFGFQVAELEPTIDSWRTRLHPDDRAAAVAGVRDATDGGRDHWSGEYRYQRKDGSYVVVLDRGYVIRDEAGAPIRMVGGMTDLTERKKLEAQFLRAQRMESVGTLAGGIAHDLNNTLAPILMSVELLKDECPPGLLDLVQTIEESAKRGADLIRQVLTFARGAAGERVPVTLTHLVKDIQKIGRETFPRNITFDVRAARDLWAVLGDPTQLHQVLMNLAVNARDAMPQGGTITMALDNTTVDATYAGMHPDVQPGPFVRISVADNGSGIPAGVRERIFEPFFTTKAIGQGTGLGLSTAMTIIRSHGGLLTFDTTPGRGTTFTICLPALVDPALVAEPDQEATDVLPRGDGELILVVDDEASIRQVVRSTLERFGYRVIVATQGAEAVAMYVQHQRDVAAVLTDMMMPIMDGPALIAALRAVNPAVRVIGSSGLASGVTSSTRLPEADAFVPKPYDAATILRTLRDVLDRP